MARPQAALNTRHIGHREPSCDLLSPPMLSKSDSASACSASSKSAITHKASTNLNQPGTRVVATVFPSSMIAPSYACAANVQGGCCE